MCSTFHNQGLAEKSLVLGKESDCDAGCKMLKVIVLFRNREKRSGAKIRGISIPESLAPEHKFDVITVDRQLKVVCLLHYQCI